ncbi:MAG: biosynthetic-type acetolactate synthase large subunit [Anaeromicrobium sp.]|jgi:acetolactate synthase-1/2/3 large subunit|uniref:biosynthetic-type acetolactate synthase large subunit n=1 Tax=Anaeromicrobium sp. TaxID=1929132 RepID=UPI0025E86789|nr:biosynthetic-type acetolactate synthase large subunit [Anaeromicrobium sp.]MCT4593666.1 biosynthetic-type acetolactate synthase large subunit [Anaeromicrobium sp.]
MKTSDIIIKCLEKEDVRFIFGYPGGAVLPLYESLRHSNIDHILVRHEQSAAHCASGYARASKKVGVCLATSGPGATNLITGIATAYMDSIPLVVITGQVNSNLIGKDVFQEADIVGSTEPFTKHNYLVKKAQDIPRIIKEAFYIAKTGRPGPVLIDIPVDIQREKMKFNYPSDINILGYKPIYKGHLGQIKRALNKLKGSKRPLICVGGGIICANAIDEFREFVNKGQIPVIHTLMGIGALNEDSKYHLGMVGIHGNKDSKNIVSKADLVMIIGARIADRAHNLIQSLNDDIHIIHIDIDPAEVGKNIKSHVPIVGDAKTILQELNEKITSLDTNDWIDQLQVIRSCEKQKNIINEKYVNPKIALNYLSDEADHNSIITADVGQNQIWTIRNFKFSGKRSILTSGGLGTMGYSLPASIGAQFASTNKVICITGDGGFQMSLGELGTIAQNNLPILIILFNNNRLGMVRELQYNAYGKGNYYGVDLQNPDFILLSKAYGIDGISVNNNGEFEEVIENALKSDKPYLIECMVDPDFATL